MSQRFVYCPTCGDPFIADPVPTEVTVYSHSLSFAFRDQRFDHECKGRDPS